LGGVYFILYWLLCFADLGAYTMLSGNERLPVVDAMAVIRFAKPGSKSASAWLLQLLERRPCKVAATALANKVARTILAMMARG
jgi:transposase